MIVFSFFDKKYINRGYAEGRSSSVLHGVAWDGGTTATATATII